MKTLKVLAVLLALASTGPAAYTQVTDSSELGRRLQGVTRFDEMQQIAERYYQEKDYMHNPAVYREYKKWNRLAWQASHYVNGQGIVDYRTQERFDLAQQSRAAITGVANANTGSWTPVGPNQVQWGINRGTRGIGRIDCLAVLPSNPQVMLAGSPSGGLFRTNDGGLNWFSISSQLPNCGISSVCFSNADPTGNTIFILTGNRTGTFFLSNFNFNANSLGVLYTNDGGATWHRAGNSAAFFNNQRNFKIIQPRGYPNTLLVACSLGMFASYNGGNTWAFASGTAGGGYNDIEQHPTNDAIIYCSNSSLSSAVYRSVDGGASFSAVNNFTPAITTPLVTELAVSAQSPNRVLLMQSHGTVNNIYLSADTGLNFSVINSQNLVAAQAGYNFGIAVSPTNANIVVAGGLTVVSSTDGGNTFGNMTVGISGDPVPANYLHADLHDLLYSPDGTAVYAATDGGVFRSTDGGVNWTDRSNGLQCTQFYRMDGYNGNEFLLVGGTQDNGTLYSTASGGTFSYAGSGDGFACDFINGDNDYFYLVENTAISRYRRSNNTISQVSGNIPLATPSFYPDVIAHPTNSNIVYAAYASTVWRSDNRGAAWTQIGTFSNNNGSIPPVITRGYNGGFAVSPAQPDRIYAAGISTLRLSNDKGANWTVISGNTGWPFNLLFITDISVRPNNADEVWITATSSNSNNRVLYSSNAGASWVDFSGTLPNVPVYSIYCTSEGDVYAGTELGVYFMDFAMNDWVPYYNGLPVIPVTDIFVNETDQVIIAATMGRGMWRSGLYTDCSPFMILGSSVQGYNFYQTSGVLQSTQFMSGSVGNRLIYRSPVKISLKPGFRAGRDSYFHGLIGPCGQGVSSRASFAPVKPLPVSRASDTMNVSN